MDVPEDRQPGRDPHRARPVVLLDRERERFAQVAVLELETVQPLRRSQVLRLRALRERQVVREVRLLHVERDSDLGGVLAQQLQHREPVSAAAQQALVDERRERVEPSAADLLDRLE